MTYSPHTTTDREHMLSAIASDRNDFLLRRVTLIAGKAGHVIRKVRAFWSG